MHLRKSTKVNSKGPNWYFWMSFGLSMTIFIKLPYHIQKESTKPTYFTVGPKLAEKNTFGYFSRDRQKGTVFLFNNFFSFGRTTINSKKIRNRYYRTGCFSQKTQKIFFNQIFRKKFFPQNQIYLTKYWVWIVSKVFRPKNHEFIFSIFRTRS